MNYYKKIMLSKKIISLVMLLFFSCQHCDPSVNYPPKDYNEIINFAKNNLPLTGKLIQRSDGYAYVKVDDDYIHKLFPMLKEPGFLKPPYFRRLDSPGAHISVVYEDEKTTLNEVGQSFTFTLEKIITVSPKKNLSFIVLVVSAPDLENLRAKYGLSKKLHGHEFHITLARKKE